MRGPDGPAFFKLRGKITVAASACQSSKTRMADAGLGSLEYRLPVTECLANVEDLLHDFFSSCRRFVVCRGGTAHVQVKSQDLNGNYDREKRPGDIAVAKYLRP